MTAYWEKYTCCYHYWKATSVHFLIQFHCDSVTISSEHHISVNRTSHEALLTTRATVTINLRQHTVNAIYVVTHTAWWKEMHSRLHVTMTAGHQLFCYHDCNTLSIYCETHFYNKWVTAHSKRQIIILHGYYHCMTKIDLNSKLDTIMITWPNICC